MRAILLTCSPYECYKLLTGDLSILVRKVKPNCELPIDVYVYVSNKGDSLITCMGLDYDDKGEIKGHHYSYCLASWLPDFPADDLTHKIVAKFTLNKIESLFEYQVDGWGSEYEISTETLKEKELVKRCCISYDGLHDYCDDINKLYAWFVDDLVIFDEPKEIHDFPKTCFWAEDAPLLKCVDCKFRHHDYENAEFCCQICDDVVKLNKAPTNYCYIEV